MISERYRAILGGIIAEMSELTSTKLLGEEKQELTFRVECCTQDNNGNNIMFSMDVKASDFVAEYISDNYHDGQFIVVSGCLANKLKKSKGKFVADGVEFLVETVYYTLDHKLGSEQSGCFYSAVDTMQFHNHKTMKQRGFDV